MVNEAVRMLLMGIPVRPVQHATLLIPYIFALDSDLITYFDRYFSAYIQVICDQNVPVVYFYNEFLVLAPLGIIC